MFVVHCSIPLSTGNGFRNFFNPYQSSIFWHPPQLLLTCPIYSLDFSLLSHEGSALHVDMIYVSLHAMLAAVDAHLLIKAFYYLHKSFQEPAHLGYPYTYKLSYKPLYIFFPPFPGHFLLDASLHCTSLAQRVCAQGIIALPIPYQLRSLPMEVKLYPLT